MFLVHTPFSYEIGHLGSRDYVDIPRGFDTDLCTVPWFARPFIPMSGKVAKPALLHDWLLGLDDPRATAVFDEALGVAEVGPRLRWLLVSSVKLWARWKRLTRRK